jgi:ABC-type iron transport system FetAB ATPase subunit
MAAVLTARGLASPSFPANLSAEAATGAISRGLFSDVSLSVGKGDVLAIQGPSGSGKTVLLKCLAHLLVYPAGEVRLNGHTAGVYDVPAWRCRIMYLPQRPALLSGTPNDFFDTIKHYDARRRYWEEKFDNISGRGVDPADIASKWNVPEECWHRSWTHLSGGEAQRIALAIAIALEPEVLLLDGECEGSIVVPILKWLCLY